MAVLWLSPLLLFGTLIVAFQMRTLQAAALAALNAVVVALTIAPQPASAVEISIMLLGGFWIALPAVLVILAGLFFAECMGHSSAGDVASASGQIDTMHGKHGSLANYCLLIGPFLESSTGFGVGFVVALAAVLRLGVKGGQALALAAFSQFMVPWGALAIGTQISSDISGVLLGDLAVRCALITAVSSLYILPLFWRLAARVDCAPSRRDQMDWIATMAILMGLLVVANVLVPIEFAALVALGVTILLRHAITYGSAAFTRETTVAAMPYIALISLLALTRLSPPIRKTLESFSMSPFADLNAFALPMSPALPLTLVGTIFALPSGGAAALRKHVTVTFCRGWPAAALTFILVGIAWVMVHTGVSEAVMAQAREVLGPSATILISFAGGIGGYLTGSNAGAAAISMPLIAGLGAENSAATWVAASAVFAGSALTAISPIRFSMGQAMMAASTAESLAGLKLLMPYTAAALALAAGTAILAISLAH